MEIDEEIFWRLTPKTIQIYIKAYRKRREIAIQDLWLQGRYFAQAIASTIQLGKQKPPPYPDMPFNQNEDNEMEQNEDWLKEQRQKAFNHFVMILSKKRG